MICAEFACVPSVAWQEMQRLPAGFLEEVIFARRYAEAYRLNEIDEKNWDSAPLRRLAKEIQHELAEETKNAAADDNRG